MLTMTHLNHYYNSLLLQMGTNFYCSCSNATFYLKTLYIGNQHMLGSCMLDVHLSDRDYI